MNQKSSSVQITLLLAALLLLALAAVMVPRLNWAGGFAVGPVEAVRVAPVAVEQPFDYEQAADNLAARWLAMARFYEAHGMLTRDNFDYERAADISAARWIAIGRGYERLGLLNEQHVAPSPPLPAAIVMGMAESLSAGDLDTLLTFWAEDATFYIYGLPPNGSELVQGQAALRAEFADEIANHQQLEVAIAKVRGNIITTREKTWHDFTRQLGVAPLEATGIYQIKDGKIANYAWTLTEESATRLKNAIFEAMPPPESAAEAVAVVTAVSEMRVVFADGTCRYDGPPALRAGDLQVTMAVQDLDREKYAFSLFTLDEGKDFIDLMVSTVQAGPPSWAHMILLKEIQPGASKTATVTLKQGPVYAVCWSQPPDIPIGNFGPFAVVP